MHQPQTTNHEDEEVEKFYNDLQTVIDKIPRREVIIIMGDLNAKVGEGADREYGIGPFGLGTCNERRDMFALFCQGNNLSITNILFQQHSRLRYTWISPRDWSIYSDWLFSNNSKQFSVLLYD